MEKKSDIPSLRILKENNRFVIRDENDLRYGSFDTKEHTEEIKEMWVAYFNEKQLDKETKS